MTCVGRGLDRHQDMIEVRASVCAAAFPFLCLSPQHQLRQAATLMLGRRTHSLSIRLPLRTHRANSSTLAAEAGLP